MILDIICVAFVLLFAIIGCVRGFAKQIFKVLSLVAALIGAYFLLMPVYNILYDLFLGPIVESLGETLSSIEFLNFLSDHAATVGKTSGLLLTEYVVLFVLYIALVLVVAIVWKILKSICHPICDLRGIRFFDRLLGFVLGAAKGLLIPCALIYLATLAMDWSFIPANITTIVQDVIDMISANSFVSEKYLLANLDKVEAFFADIWSLITTGFNAVKAA